MTKRARRHTGGGRKHDILGQNHPKQTKSLLLLVKAYSSRWLHIRLRSPHGAS